LIIALTISKRSKESVLTAHRQRGWRVINIEDVGGVRRVHGHEKDEMTEEGRGGGVGRFARRMRRTGWGGWRVINIEDVGGVRRVH